MKQTIEENRKMSLQVFGEARRKELQYSYLNAPLGSINLDTSEDYILLETSETNDENYLLLEDENKIII